jgi:aminoglycoside/choline kinase family phosphotransferase
MNPSSANRPLNIAAFLDQNGWGDAEQSPFLADFSPRRYARLKQVDGRNAILMDADANQKAFEFIQVSALLRSLGLSAPEIYAENAEHGLVLMEDFGRSNVGRMIDSGVDAMPFLQRGVDVLVHLHKNFVSVDLSQLDLPCFGGALFASQVELFLDVYFSYAKNREATRDEGESFRAAWKETLKGIELLPQSLLLRDYMPDNWMDLPDRDGVKSLGLLDFQDAGLGPIAYDLASLCEVVRRECDEKLLDEMVAYYYAQAQPALSLADLLRVCKTLAVQRHMRILGLLVKIVNATGQREKLNCMPRIWDYLHFLMQNDALKPVRDWCEQGGFIHE